MSRYIPVALAAALAAACASARVNYTDPAGPRYAAAAPRPARASDTLTVVAFNLHYALHVERAVPLFRVEGPLREADVILLQEMDEDGTRALADSLGFGYVYYPSTLHPVTGRDLGNAVLSRYPLEDDRKVVLPHLARVRRTLRTAVGATVVVGTRRVRVYSVHLATFVGNGPRARREQLAAVLADADAYPVVVVGGDFNSETVPEIALANGYVWPTRRLPHTDFIWTLDHVLVRGLDLPRGGAAGVVRENNGASDHKPVWARVLLPPETTSRD